MRLEIRYDPDSTFSIIDPSPCSIADPAGFGSSPKPLVKGLSLDQAEAVRVLVNVHQAAGYREALYDMQRWASKGGGSN